MHDRKVKIEEVIKRHAATFLEKESNRVALISVTRVSVSPDLRTGTIFISVLPENKEKASLDFTKRLRGDLHKYLMEKMKTRVAPFIDFEIDYGEKNRQLMDTLSK